MFKAYLFDLDGTIWDSEGAMIKALSDAISAETGKTIAHKVLREKLRKGKSPFSILRIYDTSSHKYWRHYQKHCEEISLFFDDTGPLLSKVLQYRKYTGAITSLKKQFTVKLLKKFGLRKYYNVLITPSECRVTKPNSKPIKMALEQLNIDSSEAIYIGDQEIDLIAAKKAGCKFGFANWNPSSSIRDEPDYIFESLADVLSLVKGGLDEFLVQD